MEETVQAFDNSWLLPPAYELLAGQITRFAMDKVAEDCKLAVSTGATEIIANEDCSCELLLRYSLPCKHYLLEAAQTGQPIPKTLFHPRWWLNGPPIVKTFIPWKPYYAQSTACNYNSQRGNEITSFTLQARIAGDKLTGLAKVRFESQLVKTNRALVDCAGPLAQDDLLPTRLPDKAQKPK